MMHTMKNYFFLEVLLIMSGVLLEETQSEENVNIFPKDQQEIPLPYVVDESEKPYELHRRNDFFLKVAGKSVPRVGRRNTPEYLLKSQGGLNAIENKNIERSFEDFKKVSRRNDFFLKAHKSIPRIGRRNGGGEYIGQYIKTIPRIGRRDEIEEEEDALNNRRTKKYEQEGKLYKIGKTETAAWPWFRSPGLYPPQKKSMPYFTGDPASPEHGLILWNVEEYPINNRDISDEIRSD